MFDDALLESRKTHSLGGKRLEPPARRSVCTLAVIGAFVGASALVHRRRARARSIPIVCSRRFGGRPSAAGGRRRDARHRPVVTSHPDARLSCIRPAQIPTTLPARRSPTRGRGLDDPRRSRRRPGSDPAARRTAAGRPGRRVRRRTATPGPGDAGDSHGPAATSDAPVLLERVEPDYPEATRRARLRGHRDPRGGHHGRRDGPRDPRPRVRSTRSWTRRPSAPFGSGATGPRR